MPDRQGVTPGYEQKHFADADKRGKLRLVASPDGAQDSVSIHQDARLYAGLFNGDERAELPLAADRIAYVHVVRGQATVNGEALGAGDALQAGQGGGRDRRSRPGRRGAGVRPAGLSPAGGCEPARPGPALRRFTPRGGPVACRGGPPTDESADEARRPDLPDATPHG